MSSNIKLNIENVKKAVKLIESLDLRIASIEGIKDFLLPLFRGYGCNTPIFHSGLTLYRSRKCNKPAYINEVSYPHPDKISKLGRVNRESQSVFYCSSSREATFFEQDLECGDELVISHWKTTDKLLVNNIGYTQNTFSSLNSNRDHQSWGDDNNPLLKTEANLYVSEYLSSKFTQIVKLGEEHHYKLTIAIAEKLLSSDMLKGLIYPTVAMRANADNFALIPPYVDQHMELTKVELAIVEKIHDFKYDIKVKDFATEFDSSGKINWKGRHPKWFLKNQGDMLIVTSQNGKLVAKDSSGNIVEPE